MSKAPEVMQCRHCGKQAAFTVRAQNDDAPSWSDVYAGQTVTVWRVLQCTACSEVTLESSRIDYIFDRDVDGSELTVPRTAEKKILYPGARTRMSLTHLPEEIKKEYEETLLVRDISIVACAVLARRTLEAIFIHEKAEGRTLVGKIDYLLKSKSIPPLLADVAHLGRQIGNLGAHFDKQEVTEDYIAAFLDFLEIILQYLYSIPTKVTEVKTRLNSAS